MGYVNIGGQTVHTSSIGNSNLGTLSVASGTITTSTVSGQYLYYNTWGSQSKIYHVLGEEIEVSSSSNNENLAIAISTLNILGKPFYDELKKNNFSFPDEIEKYLDFKFKILDRDRKIKEILK